MTYTHISLARTSHVAPHRQKRGQEVQSYHVPRGVLLTFEHLGTALMITTGQVREFFRRFSMISSGKGGQTPC